MTVKINNHFVMSNLMVFICLNKYANLTIHPITMKCSEKSTNFHQKNSEENLDAKKNPTDANKHINLLSLSSAPGI